MAMARAEALREVFEVRLNPSGCGAPPFEVRLTRGWQRVFVEPDDPEGPAGVLASRLESEEATGRGGATAWVRGRLLSRVRQAENRSHYPVFIVFEVCDDETCAFGAEEGGP